jgi:uncharacterized protein (TIGR00288 family)
MSISNIAVFIDGDSIVPKHLSEIVKEINLYGNILINNIYADWSYPNKINLLTNSRHCGITTIQADLISGKNSTDIKLAVDVMRTLYHFPNIDIFYLVVSDYDYRHLIPDIKQYGKKVCCIGSENTNTSLINICDNFTLIKNIINKDIRESIMQLINNSNKDTDLNMINMMLKRTHKFDIRNTDYNTLKEYILKNYSDILEISNCSKAIVTFK